MQNVFVTSIDVKKVRNIENFTIPLSETERKHLIITGKNGSGKTSLLQEINNVISKIKNGALEFLVNDENLIINSPNNNLRSGLFVFFEATKREIFLNIPAGIHKIDLPKKITSNDKININFIQYIVNLKADRSFARDDNDLKAVQHIDLWFEIFENQLKELFEEPKLQLVFDRKNNDYNFLIKIPDKEAFTLAQLSDGYSAVIAIIAELILRMEAFDCQAYDMQGVVLIDEIETHLHVSLQKKILPFLCAFFPKIQFIVTTHSPFVLSSISNAVICDLEKKEVYPELSGYTYDALIESYFDTDKYSEKIKEKIYRFEKLSEKENLEEVEDEEKEYYDLKRYFSNLPKFRADGLAVKLQQINLKRLALKG